MHAMLCHYLTYAIRVAKDKAEVKKEEKTEMHGDGGYYI